MYAESNVTHDFTTIVTRRRVLTLDIRPCARVRNIERVRCVNRVHGL